VAERPHDPDARAGRDFAAANGWDREYEVYTDFELPTYVGPTTFMNLPWVTDPAQLHARIVDVAIVGAPFDDAVSHRSGARFGPRAIREAQYTSGSVNSLQLGVEPFDLLTVVDAGDANINPAWSERAHALIYR
jgi:agmatinase